MAKVQEFLLKNTNDSNSLFELVATIARPTPLKTCWYCHAPIFDKEDATTPSGIDMHVNCLETHLNDMGGEQ